MGIIPFTVVRRRRWSSVALCLPLAAGLGWAMVAFQRWTGADVTRAILFGAVFAALLGGMTLFEHLGRPGPR